MNRLFPFQVMPAVPASAAEKRSGQSLVEFALTLPMLLLIIIGTVEVGNILLHYNEIQLFAREGARQAARGIADNEISQVMLQTLQDPDTAVIPTHLTGEYLTIWIVRPTIETNDLPYDATTNPWYWIGDVSGATFGKPGNCIYPDPCTATSYNLNGQQVMSDIVSFAEDSDPGGLDGETFTVVVVQYRVRLILNVPFFDPGGTGADEGIFPIQAFAVIREEFPPPSPEVGGGGSDSGAGAVGQGCLAFPIGLSKAKLVTGGEVPGMEVNYTTPGNGSVGGDFQFLDWNQIALPGPLPPDLAITLSSSFYSGESGDNYPFYPTWFINAANGSDNLLSQDDWVYLHTGGISTAVENVLDDHINAILDTPTSPSESDADGNQPRTLLVPIWDQWTLISGIAPAYQVSDFAEVQIISYTGKGTGAVTEMKIRFVRYYTRCGQAP